MEPGWGTELFISGPDGAPLAGVVVRGDGRELGRTDARGRLLLALDAEPARVELVYRDWTAREGVWDADSGKLDFYSSGSPVVLGPPGGAGE
jgi:hypothetical protein